jgi:hypothetical protein
LLNKVVKGYIFLVFCFSLAEVGKQHHSLPLLYVSMFLAIAAGVMFVGDFIK